jgi:hypothetical protein
MTTYLKNLIIGLDQLLNALLAGNPDETISSRAGKRVATCGVCAWFCGLLDRIDYRHCQESIEYDADLRH